MGLDMYLYRKTYVKQWDHTPPEKQFKVVVTRGDQPFPVIRPERVSYVTEEVCYWRKANAIHRWFVEHVQDGDDDCDSYYVQPEKLAELVARCEEVIAKCPLVEGRVHVGTHYHDGIKEEEYEDGKVVANPEVAEALLPAQSGFFFGDTDYDEYYIQDVQHTIDVLKPLLAEENPDGDFFYESSW